MSVDQVIAEISKEEIFFFHSGGGVTVSGGECLLQSRFTSAVLEECRLRGIDTAIETSLYAPWSDVERVLPFLNATYIDLKHPDSVMHQEFTGAGNELILANLARVDRSASPFEIYIRIPLIPGVNDSDASLLAILSICRDLKKLVEIEVLPYHRLGVTTYGMLQKEYVLHETAVPSREYTIERSTFLRKNSRTVPVRVYGAYVA
jgi:pyruvate formate lyase activating enzyme